ncbi:hypothetical protein E2C01_076005 [Portunus trituberculatus]|uniref:Uncharacterized protein n=1 Tax=Portunus trituberculatus TaxID=210409 RepID=A0A5B7I7L4_PORTR|nr:hypothetical protein [Portunus trituberculatus]
MTSRVAGSLVTVLMALVAVHWYLPWAWRLTLCSTRFLAWASTPFSLTVNSGRPCSHHTHSTTMSTSH